MNNPTILLNLLALCALIIALIIGAIIIASAIRERTQQLIAIETLRDELFPMWKKKVGEGLLFQDFISVSDIRRSSIKWEIGLTEKDVLEITKIMVRDEYLDEFRRKLVDRSISTWLKERRINKMR